MSNRLSVFWQELRRRRVIKVITMYAATAFIIMEAADIMLPRLGLPDWTVTLVIVLLIVGFPVAVILSWIFDLTPEGIRKTESEAYKPEVADPGKKPVRGLKISDAVIALLLVAVCILLYPKIFRRDKLREIRDLNGEITVAVMPFENLTGESANDFWQNGISEYLINDLGSSEALTVISSQVMHEVLGSTRQVSTASISPAIARETAGKINASTYITGNFIGSLNNASILLNLVSTENGELVWTCRVEGDLGNRYQDLLGHLSDTLRNHLEIKALEDKAGNDLSGAFPASSEAYRYYIDGLNAMISMDLETAKRSLIQAVEIDSTFTLAAFYLAWVSTFNSPSIDEMAYWTKRAYKMKQNLPLSYQNWIEMWNASVDEDIEGMYNACSIMERSDMQSRLFWFDLGATYSVFLGEYEKSIEAFRKVEALSEQWNEEWGLISYYQGYTWALLETGRLDEMDRIAEMGFRIDPDNWDLIVAMGARSLLQHDTVAFAHYKSLMENMNREDINPEASNMHDIGVMYEKIKDYGAAAVYFRKACELDPGRTMSFREMIRMDLNDNRNLVENLALIEAELDRNPEGFHFLWLKGVALHKLGRNEEALALLTKADDLRWIDHTLKMDIREVENDLKRQGQ